MKKLRKILVALALLALLVSSVTILVVTAEDAMEYTGTLEEAQELLDATLAAMESAEYTTDLRKGELAKVYSYLRANPVDPETEGYDEFEKVLHETSLKLANDYYTKKLLKAGTDAEKKKQIANLLTYFQAFPIPEGTPDPDPDGDKYMAYDDLVLAVNTFNYDMVMGYYNSADKKLSDDNIANAMQDLKKLYVHVETYPVSPSLPQAAQTYADYNLLSLRISEKIITDMEALSEDASARDKYKAYMAANLTLLRDHMVACPVDLETFADLTDRYNAIAPAITKAEFDQIVFLFEDYENYEPDSTVVYPELAEAAALAKVSRALSTSAIPDTLEGYSELVAKIAVEEARLAKVKEDRRLALAAQAKLYEYDFTNGMSYRTFSSDAETMGNPNADEGEYSERIKTYDNGLAAGYEAYWRYTYSTGRVSNYNYASVTEPNITNGFVHSFDMMVEGRNGQHFKGATFSNEWQDAKSNRLVGYEGNEFTMAYDAATDSISFSTGNGISPAVTVKNLAAEGQWFNVMFTYDPVTHYGKLYVDYQFVFDFFYNGWVDGATKMVIRISHSADWQYVCYDNIRYYEGTDYRDVDMFTDKRDSELFTYFVNYFLNDENDSKSRNYAYTQAKILKDGIEGLYKDKTDAEIEADEELKALKALVGEMDKFNYDDNIADSVKENNLLEIERQVAQIKEIPPYSTNVKQINQAIEALDAFIAENNDFINKADPRYNQAILSVNEVKASLLKCENAVAFSRALVIFSRATTVASMTRRQAAADEIYKAARYDKAENWAAVQDDPVFEALDFGGMSVMDYYKSIPSIIAAQLKVENSGKIIKCIDLLLEMEGYEDTEEYWLANYDEIEFFISIIRNIVSVDNYDPTYAGIDEALLQYERIDAYFFILLQEEHKAIIGAQLDRFAQSESYIEKKGICTYLERYFETNNDIDLTLPEIQEYLYRLERYNIELESYMEDYQERLETNTQYFIDTVQKMKLLTTYAELKPLYEQALEYYYAMNAITDEAKAAVAIFDKFDKALMSIEENSELFLKASQNIDYISILGGESRFALLNDCAPYYEYLDATYSDTIAERMLKYQELVDEYNGSVNEANEAVETSETVLAALRSNDIPVAVLAVINELYKNN